MNSVSQFNRATPVWSADLAGEMNVGLSFHARAKLTSPDGGVLRIAAAQAYRVWANGALLGRGPARTAHGYARIDEWPLGQDNSETMELVIEVVGYGVATFCSTKEPAFLCAELVENGRTLVWTSATNPLRPRAFGGKGTEGIKSDFLAVKTPAPGQARPRHSSRIGLPSRPRQFA